MSQLPTTATAPSTPTTQRPGITVAIEATLSPLRNGAALDLWASQCTDDCYSYEVVYDPAKISLADAQASIRATLAEHNVQVTAFLDESEPLAAAQRGPEWMARYGCTPWCINDHSAPTAPDWHTAAPTETALRNVDAAHTPAENAQLPFLAARTVVVNDKPQAYGRQTRVWLDYGTATAELSPVEARSVLNAMRSFVTGFEAVVAHAEQTAADDFDGDPEIARLDREHEDRRIKARTAELKAEADALLAGGAE